VIVEAGTSTRDLHVLWEGTARIEIEFPDGETADAGELVSGDVFGLMGPVDRVAVQLHVTAVGDCEVVIVEEGTAGAVASRNPRLSEVLNQLASTRRRRIERIIAAHVGEAAPSSPRPSGDTDDVEVGAE
jgi:CRP-like cAMP-binding protein